MTTLPIRTQPESYVEHRASGTTTYVGPDATLLFRVMTLQSALGLWIATDGKVIPARGVTIAKMLAMATSITGKSYRRGQAPLAHSDLTIWIANMKCALPIRYTGANQ